jgi:hypothetical protein
MVVALWLVETQLKDPVIRGPSTESWHITGRYNIQQQHDAIVN